MNVFIMKTPKGSLTDCVVIEEGNSKKCFSYGSLVAEIKDGRYIEYDGERFYSRTSNRHKAEFRRWYGVTK